MRKNGILDILPCGKTHDHLLTNQLQLQNNHKPGKVMVFYRGVSDQEKDCQPKTLHANGIRITTNDVILNKYTNYLIELLHQLVEHGRKYN